MRQYPVVPLIAIAFSLIGQHPDFLEIRLPLARETAIERTVTVLSDSGVTLTTVQSGVIAGTWTDGYNTFSVTAVVSSVGADSSRVRMSALWASPEIRAIMNQQDYQEKLNTNTKGDGRKFWQRMERMLAAIGAP